MAVGANSYCEASDVAGLIPRYARDGDFDDSTLPSLSRVESLIDNTSAIVNGLLAQMGFSIPVTASDVTLILKQLVSETVATMVEGIRGSGRYAPNSKAIANRGSVIKVVTLDLKEALEAMEFGFEVLGADKSEDNAEGIKYRGSDEGGSDTFPIFQRRGFGNSFTDWDS